MSTRIFDSPNPCGNKLPAWYPKTPVDNKPSRSTAEPSKSGN